MLCIKLDTLETKKFGQSNINEIHFDYLKMMFISHAYLTLYSLAYVGLPHRVLQLKVVPSFYKNQNLQHYPNIAADLCVFDKRSVYLKAIG